MKHEISRGEALINSWYNRIWPKVNSTPEPTTTAFDSWHNAEGTAKDQAPFPQGWQCPVCGRVWGPHVMECPGPHPALPEPARPLNPTW